jgi:hypothetical protein
MTFADPATGLVVTCRAIQYRDFPTVEWTIHIKNGGQEDTPILEDIQALDLRLRRGDKEGEFTLHHNQGSLTTVQDFQPFVTPLGPDKELRLGADGGRPMCSTMPYFNLQWGERGAIIAVSWLGQWAAWQFDAPEKGEGLVQAFRREKAETGSGTFKLRGLDPAARYVVEDLDGGKVRRIAGGELMDDGLRIEISDRPGAAVIVYRKESLAAAQDAPPASAPPAAEAR